ncbi:MAG: SLC13 family permease [Rickettsiales bacterium]
MTVEQSYVFAVLAATLGLFIWGKWRYDVVAVLALLAVGIPGIVTAKDVFAGFGHPAVITVAAVLVISKTLQASGFVGHIGNVLAKAEVGPSLQVFLVASIVAAMSGFMNNVGALALLLPIVLQMAKKSGRSPRSLLMPLSFGSLLGGLVTMIGTPPNIIVAAYRAEFSGTPFSMFDFTPVGLVIALAGILFITFAGWRLIPNRDAKSGGHTEMFRIDNYITEALVPKDSALIGQTIEHMLDLGGEDGVAVVAQIRRGHRRLGPRPDQLLRSGDHLLLEGEPTEIEGLLANTKLKTVGTLPLNLEDLASESIGLVEAVITPQARLVGRTSRQALLGRHYGLNLLAIARHGRPIRDRLNRVRFRAGDVLLIQGDMEAMPDALARLGCLPLPHRNIAFDAKSGIVPLAIFAGAILSIAFGLLPAAVAFIAVVTAFVLSGATTVRDVYEAIDWPIVILLGALVPVGGALQMTGGTALLADGIASLATHISPIWILDLLMVATMFLSDIINNAATAVLMAPLAAETATRIGANPDPFLMAIAIGSSCAFLTPIGHQSNVLVMGPGWYRFGDYWPMGLTLEILIVLVSIAALLFFWPL